MNKSALFFFILFLIGFKSYGQVPLIDSCAVKITVSCNDYELNRSLVSRVLKFNENGQLLEEIIYDQQDQEKLMIDNVNQYIYKGDLITEERHWERDYDTTTYKLSYTLFLYNKKNELNATKNYNSNNEFESTKEITRTGNKETIYNSLQEDYTEIVYDDQKKIIEIKSWPRADKSWLTEIKIKYETNTKTTTVTSPRNPEESTTQVTVEKYNDTKNLITKTDSYGHSKYSYDGKGFITKSVFYRQKEGKEILSSDCSYQIQISIKNLTSEAIKKMNSYLAQ